MSWGRALPASDCACFQPELAASLSGLADVLGGRDRAQSRQPSQQLHPFPEAEPAAAAPLVVSDDNLSPSVLLLHPYSWSRSSWKGFVCVWEGLGRFGFCWAWDGLERSARMKPSQLLLTGLQSPTSLFLSISATMLSSLQTESI